MTDLLLNAVIFLVTAVITVFVIFRREGRWDPEKGLYVCEFCDSAFSHEELAQQAAVKKDEE